jgi:hypothetical protein
MLYEVAIIEQPTKKEIEEGTGMEKLILAPVTILAKDPQAAAMQVALANASTVKAADPNRMQVLIRPFA